MAQQKGRDFVVNLDFGSGDVVVGGATGGTITVNNEPIDITNKDSAGYRSLLGGGKIMADITLNGFNADDAHIQSVRSNINAEAQSTVDFDVVIPGTTGGSAGSWTGSAYITSLEEAGENDGALSYNITLQSTGALTWVDLT